MAEITGFRKLAARMRDPMLLAGDAGALERNESVTITP